MKSKTLLPILMVAILALVACGPGTPSTPIVSLPPVEQPTATTPPPPSSNLAPTDTSASSSSNSSAVQVAIQGFAFSPAELTVSVGTTVTWTNMDSAPHTVTADDGSWGSKRLSKGVTFSFTFDQAGTFTYHCSVHPSMTAKVIVTP